MDMHFWASFSYEASTSLHKFFKLSMLVFPISLFMLWLFFICSWHKYSIYKCITIEEQCTFKIRMMLGRAWTGILEVHPGSQFLRAYKPQTYTDLPCLINQFGTVKYKALPSLPPPFLLGAVPWGSSLRQFPEERRERSSKSHLKETL